VFLTDGDSFASIVDLSTRDSPNFFASKNAAPTLEQIILTLTDELFNRSPRRSS